jgi:hypothetical protein
MFDSRGTSKQLDITGMSWRTLIRSTWSSRIRWNDVFRVQTCTVESTVKQLRYLSVNGLLVRLFTNQQLDLMMSSVLNLVNSLGLALQQIVGRQRWRTKVQTLRPCMCVLGVSRELWMKSLVSPSFSTETTWKTPLFTAFLHSCWWIGHLDLALVLRVDPWGSWRYVVDETSAARRKRWWKTLVDSWNRRL